MVENLVERIRQKDQRAMNQLYQMYIRELSSVCYRYVPSEADAKDVLQNSFVNIFKSIPTIDYRGEAAFGMWMKKIVVNEALNYLKERRKLRLAFGMRISEPDMELESDILTSDSEDPNASLLTADELHQLISELPDGCRTVVNLFVFEDYTHQEIADVLGIDRATSASQLYYAKRLLAQRIKEITNKRR